MRLKLILSGFLICLFTCFIQGQDVRLKFLIVESGFDFISCLEPGKDWIRADINPYSYGYAADQIRSLLYNGYFGVKYEYRFLKNKFGVTSGIRYTRMKSSIGKPTYWTSTSEFYYVRYFSDGTTTEYAKVTDINQKSDYIGIPVELRFYPFDDHPVNLFLKAGASFNFKIASKTEINFFDASMNPYRSDVAKLIESPWSYYSTYGVGVGLKIGRIPKPGINIEANLSGMLIPDKASFVRPDVGGGIQFMIRKPF
jgi:hypothetical protein